MESIVDNNNIRQESRAFKRWKILSEALQQPTLDRKSSPVTPLSPMSCNGFLEGSIRQFSSFGLINLVATEDERWLVTDSVDFPRFKVLIRRNTTSAILKPLIGHKSRIAQLASVNDNTGNCGLWPSEELLAYWCLKNPQQFADKVAVLELGAGMTGLAGLAASKAISGQSSKIIISDGNEQCLRFLMANAKRESPDIETRLLRFEDKDSYADLSGSVDLVLIADCLFLDSSRRSLVATLQQLLKPGSGKAIILAPSRSGTLDSFINLISATDDLKVHSKSTDWDEQVSALRDSFASTLSCDIYSDNLHYPILVEIMKSI